MPEGKQSQTAAALLSATEGFDHLFGNDTAKARDILSQDNSPFHQLGLGVTAFLEAALGMETGLMEEATRSLTLAESGAKKQLKSAKYSSNKGRFPLGVEWEILQADAVVLLGLTYVLSESYVGYLQCMYALNNAHNKFTKLYKSVFPNGIDSYSTPATSPAVSASSSSSSSTTSLSSNGTAMTLSPDSPNHKGFFSRLGLSSLSLSSVTTPVPVIEPDGPVEELIVSGAAFGFGLFNLVFSLLPPKVKAVAGLFGFNSDRRLALKAIAVSAARKDVHSVFAGLTLMTYHGIVLLMSGYQADEQHIIKQYRAIVEKLSSRYPNGSLWILNQAKIRRMTSDPDGAIEILREGLNPKRPGHFIQADALLAFELAWTLLSQRQYQESAEMFIRMTEMNNWSHATYLMIAAGCYISLGKREKAQKLLDKIPSLLDKRKLGGKDLPTEVYIRKKLDFYRLKQKRKGGKEANFSECIKISPADEFGLFWNTHPRITRIAAESHIKDLTSLTPTIAVEKPLPHTSPLTTTCDLDTDDELAIRFLLLGIIHRSLQQFKASRDYLQAALQHFPNVECKWLGGMAWIDLAILDLKEAEAGDSIESEFTSEPPSRLNWPKVLDSATEKLEKALSLCGSHIDFSSRLENRIALLQDEIMLKREMIARVSQ